MSAEQDKLRRIFSKALDIATTEERDRYLAEACDQDPGLRQQVDSLLSAHVEAGAFLKQNVIAPNGPGGTLRIEFPTEEKVGDIIGRYKLREKIGEGGCGVVYVAEQEEPVRRRVALKVIKLGMDTKSVVARFEAERQALAMMDHPNIAKVLDAGATDTGRPYFVMELVRGIKLTDYCDQNKLPTGERLDLFIKVCQAVQHAHQKGIIHRDLKPSNILVTLHDGVPVPKVIDFGIAKATEGRLTDLTVYTELHQFIGTPAYMSPEQAEMSALDIDTRSDIYSLGVLLYELLTGCTPFDAKELIASGLEAMRRTIREKDPLRPSTRLNTLSGEELTTAAKRRGIEAPKLMHLVRGDLDWIVMKCLEKDRTRRYETANGLAADLTRFLGNEPVVARPPSRVYRFEKMVRRNKVQAAAAALVVLSLALGVVAATWQAVRATRAVQEQSRQRQRAETSEAKESKLRQQAETDEKLAKSEATKSRQVAEFLKNMLGEVHASVALGRDTTILKDILDRTAERAGRNLKEQPEVETEVREIMGDTYQALFLYPQARAMHREALRLREVLFGTNSLAVATSLEKLSGAVTGGAHQDFLEGERLLRQAMAIRQKLSTVETADMVRCLNSLAVLRIGQRDLRGGESLFNEALAMGKRVFNGGESVELADSLLGLVQPMINRGDLAGAEANAREGVRIKRKRSADSQPDVPDADPILLEAQGKMLEAEKWWLQALANSRRRFGDTNPGTLDIQSMLARFYAMQGRERDAEPLWRNLLGVESEGASGNVDVSGGSSARKALEALLLKPSLIPLAADSGQEPALWRYTLTASATNWAAPGFEDNSWLSGPGSFGNGWYQSHVRTPWDVDSTNIWLRREFDLAEIPTSPVVFRAKYGTIVRLEIFLNGVEAASATGFTVGAYWQLRCSRAAQAALKPGRNVIAVHVGSRFYDAYFDAGLYAAPELRRGRLQFAEVLKDALQKQPGNVDLLAARANVLTQCGEWKEAAAGYTTLTELQPTNHLSYFWLAPLLLQNGEIARYEHLRNEMLDRFSGTTNPTVAERMAMGALLLPLSGTNLDTAVALADTGVSASTNHQYWNYFVFAKGLAEYRGGHFAEARQRMEHVLAKAGEDPSRDVAACMVLAMVHHQLHRSDESRSVLARGTQIAEREMPKAEDWVAARVLGGPDWIFANVLMSEAQALITGQ